MKKLRKVITFVSVLLTSVCGITGCGKSEWEEASNSIEPDEVFMFDGDRTYMDNSAMLPLITGKWVSTDGHFVIVYTEDYQVTVSVDDETVLQTMADYVHLEPGGPTYTEFNLEKTELIGADGTKHGIVDCLSFEPSDGDGHMILCVYEKETDSNAVKIILNKEN